MTAGSSESPPVIGMATNAGKSDDSMQCKMFTCCVCYSADVSNILSECLHTLCTTCADTLKVSDGYLCPVCKEKNEKVLVNELICKISYQNEVPICGWCADNEDTNISVGHCQQCDQWLCAECVKGHNRMPQFRSHSIKMVGGFADKSLKCEIHPCEALELYCETCGVLTCRDCQLSVHRDHGGHRWVKEKADLLRPGLQVVISALKTQTKQLHYATSLASKGPLLLRESVEEAKASYQSSVNALLVAVKSTRESIDACLDAKLDEHVQRLLKTLDLMNRLQSQIDYTLQFTQRLLEYGDKDPASLVQLAKSIDTRITKLTTRAERLVADDCGDPEGLGDDDDDGDDLVSCKGWRTSAASRAVSLCTRQPEDLVHRVATLCWTLRDDELEDESNPAFRQVDVNCESLPPMPDVASEDENSIEGDITPRHLAGCAVCHGHGVLLTCCLCQRAFHPDCHLPRHHAADAPSGGRQWTCGLCALQPIPPKLAAKPRRVRDAQARPQEDDREEVEKWSFDQVEAGQRLLLSLLCHPGAVYFTSSLMCPICCRPVVESVATAAASLTSTAADEDEGATTTCDVFHRIHTFRELLEAAEEGEHGKPFDAWIRSIDLFASDIALYSTESKNPCASQLLSDVAGNLRDALDSSVETFYPAFFDASL